MYTITVSFYSKKVQRDNFLNEVCTYSFVTEEGEIPVAVLIRKMYPTYVQEYFWTFTCK